MTEFITRNYGQKEFEVIIKTDSKEHYKATEDFARKLIDHAKPMTNADRIRAMSDEELANWLDYMYGRCDWCDTNKVGTDDCSDIACTDCIFEGLKQPAEE